MNYSEVSVSERHMAKRRSRRLKTVYSIVFVTAVVLLTALTAAFFTIFKIKDVAVVISSENGIQRYLESDILSFLDVKDGQNLYLFDDKAAARALRSEFPYITSVSVKRIAPSTLTLSLRESLPAYYVVIAGETYLLSEGFEVVDKGAETAGLVHIKLNAVKECLLGSKLVFADKDVEGALAALLTIFADEADLPLKSVDMTDKFNITADLGGRYTVTFGDFFSLREKYEFVKGIAAKLHPEDRGYIDVSDLKEATIQLSQG